MKNLKWRGMLLIVILISFYQKHQTKTNDYQNLSDNYKINYPADWRIDSTLVTSGYLSLYSPETQFCNQASYELLCGIKVEIYTLKDKSKLSEFLSDELPSSFIKKNNQQLKQYKEETENCTIILTPLYREKQTHLIIGYVPEKDKLPKYGQLYNKIVLSFEFLKSG